MKRKSPSRTASYAEEQEVTAKHDRYICPICWDNDNPSVLTLGWLCPVHGLQKHGIPMSELEKSVKYRGLYETEMIMRNDLTIGTGKTSSLMVNETEVSLLERNIRGAMMLGNLAAFGDYANEAIKAAAYFCWTHGLDPSNPGEFWMAPKIENRKNSHGEWEQTVVGFVHGAGYKGLFRSARRISNFTVDEDNIEIIDGATDPQRIVELRANTCKSCRGESGECPKCHGTGLYNNGPSGCLACGGDRQGKKGSGVKECKRCNSLGTLDPKGIVVVRVPIHRLDVYEKTVAANEKAHAINQSAGSVVMPYLPYRPYYGEAVYQIGDQVPERRTPIWVSTKNATIDAIRKAYDLSFDVRGDLDGFHVPEHGIVAEPVFVDDDEETESRLNDQIGIAPSAQEPVDDGEIEEVETERHQPESVPARIISGQEFLRLKQDIMSKKGITADKVLGFIQDVVGKSYNPTNLTDVQVAQIQEVIGG